MRIKSTAITQLNGTLLDRPRDTDNRDQSAMVEYYIARTEALERELIRVRAELASVKWAIVHGVEVLGL